jgi:hypothetical protein
MSGILISAAGNLMSPPPAPPPPPPPTAVTVTATPNTLTGTWKSGSAPVYTNTAVLTPAGGVVPYSLGIQPISGSLDWSLYVNPNVVTGLGPWTMQLSFTGPAHRETIFRATITDAVGNTAFADIDAIANPGV